MWNPILGLIQQHHLMHPSYTELSFFVQCLGTCVMAELAVIALLQHAPDSVQILCLSRLPDSVSHAVVFWGSRYGHGLLVWQEKNIYVLS